MSSTHLLILLGTIFAHTGTFTDYPEAIVQIAKVSKLLLSLEQGGGSLEMGQSRKAPVSLLRITG